ncbi:hypothetical protein BB561_002229 [Smittium simulii]|uniref:RING-type domain-containing protein n=1 Tax=Smittium simulii TaxID=133385 RepID=A0A2T9YR68_9FUNG|nr:hypothetical protein BB561_002229 [Smittium simulii]
MGDNINDFNDSWADRIFWIQSILDIVVLLLGLSYFAYIAIINGFNIKFSGIFILSNIQSLLAKLNITFKRLSLYQKALNEMNSIISCASKEEIKNYGGVCPICWEKLETAAKISCDHIFHRYCLRKWIEKHPNCPICRVTIKSCQKYSKLWTALSTVDSYGAELIYSNNTIDIGDRRLEFGIN